MDLQQAQQEYIAMMTHGVAASEEALRAIVDDMRRQLDAGDRPEPIALPEMDDAARQAALLDRVRRQAAHAARQTVYYGEVFGRSGLDPERLTWADFARLPITPKAHLRDRQADFVAANVRPQYRSFTGGTTGGRPIGLWWSEREFALSLLTQAIADMPSPRFAWDATLNIGDSTQFLSLSYGTRLSALYGDAVIWGRMFDPDATVDQLTEYSRFGDRLARPTEVAVFPSYWGQVVEAARRRGRGPGDHGLRILSVGGEVATTGLLRRSREVFGAIPIIFANYGASEFWGTGSGWSEDTVHWQLGDGAVWELLDPETWAPASPGGVATLVVTVLPPYRETMPLLRYDIEDLVQVPAGDPVRSGPGVETGPIMGRRSLSIRHADGRWTCPRQVLEALEDLDEVQLPARCGFWAEGNGVAVELVLAGASAETRRKVGDSLERWGVPLVTLHLRESRDDLARPYPLRCDGR